MERDDQAALALGRMVGGMISDVRQRAPEGSHIYAHRKIGFPGGEVCIFIASDDEVAEAFVAGAARQFDVVEMGPVTPPEQRNRADRP